MKFRVELERKKLIYGILGLVFSATLPTLLPERLFGVLRMIQTAADTKEHIYLLSGFFRLVIMNLVKTTPIYLSCFFVCESIRIWVGKRELLYTKSLLVLAAVYATYQVIGRITFTEYTFGAPAFLITLTLTMFVRSKWCKDNLVNRVVIISTLFMIAQSLNSFPSLERLRFGGGELSADLHKMAALMGYSAEMEIVSSVLLTLLLLLFAIIMVMLHDKYKNQMMYEEREEMLNELNNARMEALSLRTFTEMQHVVHDLKTPLTTIIGLSSLTQMLTTDANIQGYQDRIMKSADVMNDMISEVLQEKMRNEVSVVELVKQASSYLGTNEQITAVIRYEFPVVEKMVLVNRIRMIRAIINLAENAYDACAGVEKPEIVLGITYVGESSVHIYIRDNGCGIDEEQKSKIWDAGYSGKSSSGIGLAFVKSIVEQHGGHLEIESAPGCGTQISIVLKGE